MSAEHREIAIEEYHRHPALGCSMLKAYADHPKLFDCRHVTKDGAPFKGTTSTEFGTRVDAWLLEREICLPIPAEVLGKGGAKSTKAWRTWAAENSGFVHFTERDITICRRIERNIQEHPDAAALLGGMGQNQYSIFWTDPVTGMDCKNRFDRVTPAAWVDVKTAASLEDHSLRKQAEELRYHWQSVWYSRGGRLLFDEDRPFVFLYIKNSEPYEIRTVVLRDRWLQRAEHELNKTLEGIQTAMAVNYWLPPGYGRRVELDQPEWCDNKQAG